MPTSLAISTFLFFFFTFCDFVLSTLAIATKSGVELNFCSDNSAVLLNKEDRPDEKYYYLGFSTLRNFRGGGCAPSAPPLQYLFILL
ncbi:hypothetical protein BpHYR1_053129 [Brachionus plicatilis]|uniref:Secreted protein n=1 Tax=Brachionus plicatilis TaxID=10195 RepID=A0A3M7QFE9_BRAPC|nr:hypothetical protein BpHYR1_053129 [Brachionus plicatilis]